MVFPRDPFSSMPPVQDITDNWTLLFSKWIAPIIKPATVSDGRTLSWCCFNVGPKCFVIQCKEVLWPQPTCITVHAAYMYPICLWLCRPAKKINYVSTGTIFFINRSELTLTWGVVLFARERKNPLSILHIALSRHPLHKVSLAWHVCSHNWSVTFISVEGGRGP